MVEAVHKAVGGQFQVHKGGSRAKGTQLSNSDLDLKLVGPRQFRQEDRKAVERCLEEKFPGGVDRTGPNVTKIQGRYSLFKYFVNRPIDPCFCLLWLVLSSFFLKVYDSGGGCSMILYVWLI